MDFKITELQDKMAGLVNKWKDNKPKDNSADWWRWRADKSLYYAYRQQLQKLQKNAPPKQASLT